MNKKTLFISTGVLVIAVFIAAISFFKSDQASKDNAYVNSNAKALIRAGAPIKGAKNAKVTIVEFFDPACGTCSQFYPLVNQIIDEYPDQVNVMMRYAPLHQGSDEVVEMLEAAHLQGKFWQALEVLFANQRRWVVNHVSQPRQAQAMLASIGLNPEQFSADMSSAKVAQKVQQDMQDGQTLNVRATPEFFVNGRPMPSFGYKELKTLVDEAVAEAY